MNSTDLQILGWIAFYGVAAAGFAALGLDNIKRAIKNHRAGQKVETARSVSVGLAMSVAAIAAGLGTAFRLAAFLMR